MDNNDKNVAIEFAKWLRLKEWQDIVEIDGNIVHVKRLFMKGKYEELFELFLKDK